MSFRVQPSQQTGVLHDDRQHPGQRPEAYRAHENQPQIAMSIPRSTSNRRRISRARVPSTTPRMMLRAAEGEQQRQHRGGQRPGEDDSR